jgi:predicted nucleic acid-binding protein
VKAVDTSVVVAAFASWHEQHDVARRVLDGGVGLIDHCVLEAYSVLTRLPPPHRSPAPVVDAFLRARFPKPWLRLSARQHRTFVLGLASRGVTGGAVYDALVAATADANRVTLVTCDGRASAIYELFGISYELVR